MRITVAAPRKRLRPLHHVAAAAVLALCAWAAGTSTQAPASIAAQPARHATGPATRFEHVAVFAPGTSSVAIEEWRRQVLARVHVLACAGERPCLRRALRLSSLGPARAEVLAFDLDADAPAAERAALFAAAAAMQPHADIHHDTTPRQAAGG